MRNHNMTRINGNRLKKELADRDLSLTILSEDIGYSKTYISKCCQTGFMRKSGVEAIEAKTGILAETFVDPDPIVEKIPVEIPEDAGKIIVDRDVLEDIIRVGVAKGIEDAQNTIFGAFYGALKLYKNGGEKNG